MQKKIKPHIFFYPPVYAQIVTQLLCSTLSEKSFLLWKIDLVKSLVDLSVHGISLRLPEDTLPQVTKSLRLITEAEEWLYLGGVWELSWEPVS